MTQASTATTRTVRLAAVTGQLEWAYRQTCSHERFDFELARSYVRVRTDRVLRQMNAAAEQGADLVLGPEYMRGSELFMTSRENRRKLNEPIPGPTAHAMGEIARTHHTYLAAAYDAQHGEHDAQTGVIIGRNGELAGLHVKGEQAPSSTWADHRDWFDLDIGRTGLTVCSDAQQPDAMLQLARDGMQLLLIPGVGFAGPHWRAFVTVRALDAGCPVVYADLGRALIVDAKGNVLAETQHTDDIICADVPVPASQLQAT